MVAANGNTDTSAYRPRSSTRRSLTAIAHATPAIPTTRVFRAALVTLVAARGSVEVIAAPARRSR